MQIDLYRVVLSKKEENNTVDMVTLELKGMRILELLYSYRRALISVKFDLQLSKATLSQLADDFSEYEGFSRREFCKCIYTILDKCKDKTGY